MVRREGSQLYPCGPARDFRMSEGGEDSPRIRITIEVEKGELSCWKSACGTEYVDEEENVGADAVGSCVGSCVCEADGAGVALRSSAVGFKTSRGWVGKCDVRFDTLSKAKASLSNEHAKEASSSREMRRISSPRKKLT